MSSTQEYISHPTRRVDGPLKVSGAAKYAAEYGAASLLHGYLVSSTVAAGKIKSVDISEAEKVPGFVRVFTHENRPKVSDNSKDYMDMAAAPGEHFRPLASDEIFFSDQPIALVVAESFEAARDAAALVKVEYEAALHQTDLNDAMRDAYVPPQKRDQIAPPPKPRGNFESAFQAAPVQLSQEYRVAIEHHNPMEPHATTCVWNGDGSLTVYDKTQGSQNAQAYLSRIFGLKPKQLHVINSFVGGGFGSGLRPQYPVFFAVMASQALERSVRVVLTRDQMFSFTYRPETIQTVKLGADADGKLTAIRHDAVAGTSTFEDHQEVVVNWTGLLYDAKNVELTYQLAKLNTYSPGDMRAPGAVLGVFAIESAMDELAVNLKMDPVALRLKNYTEEDENDHKKYTSKSLRQCYREGAEAFGWDKRNPEPRSMRDGHELIGWGMASMIWEANMAKTEAEARLSADGRLTVASATSDIGTGTYTLMAQVGADVLGLPIERVTAKLGDSDLPTSPIEGGSWTAASTSSAVMAACENLKKELLHFAHHVPGHPIGRAGLGDVVFADGRIMLTSDAAKSVSLTDVMAASGKDELAAAGMAAPNKLELLRYVSYTHAAVFCEVRVDEELGAVRIKRIVTAAAAGRILNPKTARSQVLGGVVMGIGSALTEETFLDNRLGRFMNHNLAEYHIPVNADVEDIEVIFVNEPDDKTSPIGAKGLGEIGIVGTGAAIANAVYHATGRRIRELPITIDKVLGLS